MPFQWQPANPGFGLFGNTFTFLAIAFERYIVSATRMAESRFTSAAVASEANTFVRQEAQHARAHRAHAKAMIGKYPGLQETYVSTNAAYDELLDSEDVEFHLAYIANLEATFTPLFKMVLDNRRQLFEGSDERVGTMLLWHFVEEIEHRSSALLIHHDVTPDRWYRVRKAPRSSTTLPVFTSLCSLGLRSTFRSKIDSSPLRPLGRAVSTCPSCATGSPRPTGSHPSMLSHVPGRDLRAMLWRETKAQTPRHDPANEPLPTWVTEWHAAYDSGADVTTYEGVRL